MKKTIIIRSLACCILCSISFLSKAQQRAQYTQYIMNNYVLNPAVGGINNYWDIKTGLRTQWMGFGGAPATMFVSAHRAIGYPNERVRNSHLKAHQGIGGYAFHDVTGPLSMTGIYLSYSYHLKLSKTWTASAGAFLGLMQYKINGNDLVFVEQPNDPLIGKTTVNRVLPDGTVGLWLHSDKMFVGLSMNQIFGNRIKLPGSVPSTGTLNYHYFFTYGYKFTLSRTLDFIPSTMIKYVQAAPVQFDINARLKYRNMFWVGASYRHQDAVAMMIGFLINNKFEIGYSYDATTSRIRTASWGTQEIILGINVAGTSKKGRVLCPMDYWN